MLPVDDVGSVLFVTFVFQVRVRGVGDWEDLWCPLGTGPFEALLRGV